MKGRACAHEMGARALTKGRAGARAAVASVLATRAIERRPLGLHDPHDRPAVPALAPALAPAFAPTIAPAIVALPAHAARTRFSRPPVHQKRIRDLPLLDVVDVRV